MSYDGGTPAYRPPWESNPEANRYWDGQLAGQPTGDTKNGTLVIRDGKQYLQQQNGTDSYGRPQYAYVATDGNFGAAAPKPAISLTDPGLIARLAQGGTGSGMGGVVGDNPYGGILAAPAAPQNNGILQQFLTMLGQRQGNQAVTPGTPGMAPLPTQPTQPGPSLPPSSIGGGSSMPSGGGNSGFLAMLQGLKASGSPMSAPVAPVSK